MSHSVRVFLIPVLLSLGLLIPSVHRVYAEASTQPPIQQSARNIAQENAQQGAQASGTANAPPGASLYELFTSHGCSSCPPAEALLGQILQENPSVVVLEWHVDYWNSLVHGGDGSWTDPFSSARWSERQRRYNQRADLQGRTGVYTPQVIINGQWAGIGSSERAVRNALDSVAKSSAENAGANTSLNVVATDSGLQVSVDSAVASELWLVDFIVQATTEITAGENRYRRVTNHHMVSDAQPVARIEAGNQQWSLARTAQSGVGCALLVQDPQTGTVRAAAYCPDNHVESGL